MKDELILCDRWTSHFIREMNFQLSIVSGSSEFNKFEWLEKTVTPQMSDRVAKVLSIKNNNSPMRNNVTTRKADSWVTINRSLRKTFDRIHPKKSDGAFFPKWGTSSGEGRLQFTEWFKSLAQTNQDNSITIFDPYFED
ncbi:VPA1262 family N-terminal domain-containing protein, partial [Vibrio parahaemolyticus]